MKITLIPKTKTLLTGIASVLGCLVAGDLASAASYSVKDLGTLGGTSSSAYGINASGQVVGNSNPAGSGAKRAFLYSNNVMTDLGTLGGGSSYATAINDAGQIAGSAFTASNEWRAFRYSNGTMTDFKWWL